MNFTVFVLMFCFSWQIEALTLTSSQQKSIDELRPLVQNELYLPYMRTDAFLLRWLEDREFDVAEAKEKLLKAIKWRKDNGIDNILTEEVPFVHKHVKYDISSRDSLGNPVITIDFQTWDIRRVSLAGKLDLLNRHLVKMMETAVNKSAEIQKTKPEANQWILFGNFNGFTLKKQGCLACIPFYVDYIGKYENYFTGSTRFIININAPRSYTAIADIARGVMSPGTKRAFKIYDSNKLGWDFLDTIIPRSELPIRHGGTRKTP